MRRAAGIPETPHPATRLLRQARYILRTQGPVSLLKVAGLWVGLRTYYPLLERVAGFDRKHGTETSALVTGRELGYNPGQHWYTACAPGGVHAALALVPISDGEFAFVDYGCGKGRALLIASEYPFIRIDGVELSPLLVDVARENLTRYRPRNDRVDRIQLYQMDASEYEPPRGDAVFFLANPFPIPLLDMVLERIRTTSDEGSQRYILYEHEERIGQHVANVPWLELVARRSIAPLIGTWALYRIRVS